jgi:dienelactone hydrolase
MRIALSLCLLGAPITFGSARTDQSAMAVKNESVQISSGGKTYPAYLAYPTTPSEGKYPAVVLIH